MLNVQAGDRCEEVSARSLVEYNRVNGINNSAGYGRDTIAGVGVGAGEGGSTSRLHLETGETPFYPLFCRPSP